MSDEAILVINTGSSSLKFGLCVESGGAERFLFQGAVRGIGRGEGSQFDIKDAAGRTLRSETLAAGDQGDALNHIARWLSGASDIAPRAVGHRIVHGGPHLTEHQPVTATVLETLRRCVHFAPLHIPAALHLVDKAARAYPGVPQFACFDTVFHNSLPEAVSRFALPGQLFDDGIRRYGFHGLSYESIVNQLGADLPPRAIIAHLGNGASLCAVRHGRSIDTSMGLTPMGGIPMSTRSGDLDPGVLLYLLRTGRAHARSLEKLLNEDSGLKALSGGRQDMRDIQAAAEVGDRRALMAIQVFCMSVRKLIGAYATQLEGLDMLIFTGGIGEHSASIRRGICQGLGFLGIRGDDADPGAASDGCASVPIRVVASQEEIQIARHCRAMLRAQNP